MTKAFSLAYGLDPETEVASFWAWLNDARHAVNETGEGSPAVRDFVEGQRVEIERIAATEKDPDIARFDLTLAVAMVGFHCTSLEKLLKGLEDYGLLLPRGQAPIFHTIAEAPIENDPRPH